MFFALNYRPLMKALIIIFNLSHKKTINNVFIIISFCFRPELSRAEVNRKVKYISNDPRGQNFYSKQNIGEHRA